jgi:hypothetical protein
MGDRYVLWVLARLVAAAVLIGWVGSYMMPDDSGNKEFKKAMEAMKQIRSVRVAYSSSADPARRFDKLWEIACSQNAYHYQEHTFLIDPNAKPGFDRDELLIGSVEYIQKDGAWQQAKNLIRISGDEVCHQLASAQEATIMPPYNYMIQMGVIQKGPKKTVNGVCCRDWNVAFRNGPAGIEHDTICLGLDDHLPYERTVDWSHSRMVFSDYNSSFQLDLPDGALQAASAAQGSN